MRRIASMQLTIEDDTKRMESFVELVKQKLEEAQRYQLTFLLLGLSGVGKSSTVNSLFNQIVAPVGDFVSTTLEPTRYEHVINNIKVDIYDTPGLCDGPPGNENDQHYLEQICSKMKKVDSVLYVVRLDQTRPYPEKPCIKVISEALGKEIWQRAVIVFTFADKVDPEKYDEMLRKRGDLIRKEISIYAGERVAGEIPAVGVNNKGETTPDGEPWLGELFTKVFRRLSDNGILPFLLTMADKITTPQPSSAGGAGFTPQAMAAVSAPYIPPPSSAGGAGFIPPPLEEQLPRIVLNERQNEEIKSKLRSSGLYLAFAMLGARIGAIFGPWLAPPGAAAGLVVVWIIKLFGWNK
jgi:GTP-binding protein EngB required for normal cell division